MYKYYLRYVQKKADVEINVLIYVKSSPKLTAITDIRLSVMQHLRYNTIPNISSNDLIFVVDGKQTY